MGNAAHSLHPVAGQGFNLALRDSAHLAMVIATAQNEKVPLGNLASLNAYLNQQQFDQQKTISFSDQLPTVFGHRFCAVGLVRCLGLSMLDVMPTVKSHFINHAAGMHDGAGITY